MSNQSETTNALIHAENREFLTIAEEAQKDLEFFIERLKDKENPKGVWFDMLIVCISRLEELRKKYIRGTAVNEWRRIHEEKIAQYGTDDV